MNPDFVVHQKFEFSGVRALPPASIMQQGQATHEQIFIIYLVYTNPGELLGLGEPLHPPAAVKVNLKKVDDVN